MSGKLYRQAKKTLGKQNYLQIEEAINTTKKISYSKFDESCDLAIILGIDPKKSDQSVRGIVPLPHGRGKQVRVAVICNPEKAQEAKDAGADLVGDSDLIDKIKSGEINFDICIATPDMMGKIGQIARILGPKGLMPNPKLGTVTPNIVLAVEKAKKGQVEFRSDKGGVVHVPIGKLSFDTNNLVENAQSIIDAVVKAKPSGVKGTYLKTMYLSGSMTPSIQINVNTINSK